MRAITVEYLIEEMEPDDNNKITNTYVEKSMKDAKDKYDELHHINHPNKIYNLDIRIICLEPGMHTETLIYKGTPNMPF